MLMNNSWELTNQIGRPRRIFAYFTDKTKIFLTISIWSAHNIHTRRTSEASVKPQMDSLKQYENNIMKNSSNVDPIGPATQLQAMKKILSCVNFQLPVCRQKFDSENPEYFWLFQREF